jgi:hypothetical protein
VYAFTQARQFTGIPASLTFRKVSFLLCVCITLIIYWKGFRFHFYHYFRFQVLYRVFKRKLTANIPAERIRIKIRFLIMLFGYLCYQCAWILWFYYKRYLLGEMEHSDKLETVKKFEPPPKLELPRKFEIPQKCEPSRKCEFPRKCEHQQICEPKVKRSVVMWG